MAEPENRIEGHYRDTSDASPPDLGYPGALELDVEKYLPYVEGFDISEEQKAELLKNLWSIMRSFVEIGWGLDTLQVCIPALKEFSSEFQKNSLEQKEKHLPFNEAAEKNDQGKVER